jgi:hypothetical protein
LIATGLSEAAADAAAVKFVRSAFGGRLAAIFTGGSPTSPAVTEFVNHCFVDLMLHDSCLFYTLFFVGFFVCLRLNCTIVVMLQMAPLNAEP